MIITAVNLIHTKFPILGGTGQALLGIVNKHLIIKLVNRLAL